MHVFSNGLIIFFFVSSYTLQKHLSQNFGVYEGFFPINLAFTQRLQICRLPTDLVTRYRMGDSCRFLRTPGIYVPDYLFCSSFSVSYSLDVLFLLVFITFCYSLVQNFAIGCLTGKNNRGSSHSPTRHRN